MTHHRSHGSIAMTKQRQRNARDIATDIVRRLQAAGFAAWWVGGCVRDFLLGREPQDFDIATAALPAQIETVVLKNPAEFYKQSGRFDI